jgi:hypothetical protein
VAFDGADAVRAPTLAASVRATGLWWCETVEEARGSLFYAETRYNDLYIGFLAMPSEPVTMFIDGLELQETTSKWRVNDYAAHATVGRFDPYFGSLAFCLTANLLNEIRLGSALTVAIPGKAVVPIFFR